MITHILICPLFGFGAWLAGVFNVTTSKLMEYTLAGMILPYVILAVVGISLG